MTETLHEARDFEFEPFVHGLQWAQMGVAEQIAGTTSTGPVTCKCGGWSLNVLDNPAGQAAARTQYAVHVNTERRARITQVTTMLLDVDLTQHAHDIQHTLAKAVSAIEQANRY